MQTNIDFIKKTTSKEHIDSIYKIISDEWGEHYEHPIRDNIYNEMRSAGEEPDNLPKIFYALNRKNEVIGTASLLGEDIKLFEHLTPWIGNFFVLPQYRNQGVGRHLYTEVISKAKSLNFDFVYLYTKDKSYYENREWGTLKSFNYKDEINYLMKLSIKARIS